MPTSRDINYLKKHFHYLEFIPKRFALNVQDVRHLWSGKKDGFWIVEPQTYEDVYWMRSDDYIVTDSLNGDGWYTENGFIGDPDVKRTDVVGTGSGFDLWYKVTPELVTYVRDAIAKKNKRRKCETGQTRDKVSKQCRPCKRLTSRGGTCKRPGS